MNHLGSTDETGSRDIGERPSVEGFSSQWLTLREPVDLRSRNRAVSDALRAQFADYGDIDIVDIGCGTGANLRATAPLLGARQTWTLIDNDPVLLHAAEVALIAWADSATRTADGLTLDKPGQRITVRFRRVDLIRDLDQAIGDKPDLITASAFFDLVSPSFIERFAKAASERNAAVYAVLTYNGLCSWTPPQRADEWIQRAFNTHQATDKGFGPAAGPLAPELLGQALGAANYRIECGDSHWRLGQGDDALLSELIAGISTAVVDTGLMDQGAVATWRGGPRLGGLIGHIDTLGLPPR